LTQTSRRAGVNASAPAGARGCRVYYFDVLLLLVLCDSSSPLLNAAALAEASRKPLSCNIAPTKELIKLGKLSCSQQEALLLPSWSHTFVTTGAMKIRQSKIISAPLLHEVSR